MTSRYRYRNMFMADEMARPLHSRGRSPVRRIAGGA
jgi:hypothetical protein